MTQQEIAEKFVRTKIPSLDCGGCSESCITSDGRIIGHPIKLNDWLRVLQGINSLYTLQVDGRLWDENNNIVMRFDLSTGQPKEESDYRTFNELVDNK